MWSCCWQGRPNSFKVMIVQYGISFEAAGGGQGSMFTKLAFLNPLFTGGCVLMPEVISEPICSI